MKCPTCGHENRPEARFCKQCGQSLDAQAAPSAPPSISETICPACGATAKPGARFCPRCGEPLPAEAPPSSTETQPSIPSLPQPDEPPPTPPSPAETAPPARRSPGWLLWAGGIVAFICVVALAVATVVLGPRLIGTPAEPAATPTPTESATTTPTPEVPPAEIPPTQTPTVVPLTSPPLAGSPTVTPTLEGGPVLGFDAQVGLSATVAELRAGEQVTITVTVTNAGQVTFGSLRYQLLGEWKPVLTPIADAVVEHEMDVGPTHSDAAIFVLQAAQTGIARLQANVTVKTREETPAVKSVSSVEWVEIVVAE